MYRLNFPANIKSQASSDIVLCCQICHERATRLQDTMKKKLADSFDLPLNEKSDDQKLDYRLGRARNAALMIEKFPGLPEQKRKQ